MNNLKTANAFVFNAEIDTNYLNSLYGDDYRLSAGSIRIRF